MHPLAAYTSEYAHRVIEILADLVRIPSENTPPAGAEQACQLYVARFLEKLTGWEVDVYSLDDLPGLKEHPLFWPGRNYTNRPNVTARRRGAGGGRSLLLSGHIDTVPRGSLPWSDDPFSTRQQDGRLYGRGSNDMKAGIASALFIAEALHATGATLAGDLLIETVVDEEFGGVNGTLAARIRGYIADAAIIGEPSALRICHAQRGGRIAHITFRSPGDIFADRKGGVIEQLNTFLNALPQFARQRASSAPTHPAYAHIEDRAPVCVTRISTGPWATSEPIAIPSQCQLELYWQAVPGESQAAVEEPFFLWLDALITANPRLYATPPEVQFPIRWLPGSAILEDDPLVRELAACARPILGGDPLIQGIEAPCDMYIFHQMANMPAVLWGPAGANAHAPDEYVDVDTLIRSTKVLAAFVAQWTARQASLPVE